MRYNTSLSPYHWFHPVSIRRLRLQVIQIYLQLRVENGVTGAAANESSASMNATVKAGSRPGTLRTTWEEVTYDDAVSNEQNMLQKLTYWQNKHDFLTYLLERRHDIEAIVAEHLGIPRQDSCVVMPPKDWIHGSFNACLPVHLDDGRSLIVRFPLPYKVGEFNNPGNSDEKLRCEAATYAWINQNCLDVPLP